MKLLARIDEIGLDVTYELFDEQKFIPDSGVVTVYGIKISTSGGDEVTISDVSSDRRTAEAILRALWRGETTCIGARDVIEDMLG